MSQPSVLITGCSSGIGRALADVFQQAGYQVWATARKADDLAALSDAGFHALQLDVNDGLGLGQLAERLKAEIGGLDVLINNAGYGAPWGRCSMAALRPCASSLKPTCSRWSV